MIETREFVSPGVRRALAPLLMLVCCIVLAGFALAEMVRDHYADTAPEQTDESASPQHCPENSRFKHLPCFTTPSDSGDAKLRPHERSPYRDLEVLPRPLMIAPALLPNHENILL